jgi:Putative MetA-pathway of phenol degradation
MKRKVELLATAGIFVCTYSFVFVLPAAGQDADKPDKGGYNLFNSVRVAFMRDLDTDRPDKTESPYTVDAGHFQLEMDFANFTYDKTESTTTRVWNIVPVNVKIGLLHNMDIQFVFDDYRYVRTENPASVTTTQSGVGDFTTRLKVNLWGNDSGRTALGILPFLKFPTSMHGLNNNAIEGGIIFPLAVKVPCDFDMGMMTEVDLDRNDIDRGYHASFVNSVTICHDFCANLGGYMEFFSEVSAQGGVPWIGATDFGSTYLLTENIQLDSGVNIGVTHMADDVNLFAGITVRL